MRLVGATDYLDYTSRINASLIRRVSHSIWSVDCNFCLYINYCGSRNNWCVLIQYLYTIPIWNEIYSLAFTSDYLLNTSKGNVMPSRLDRLRLSSSEIVRVTRHYIDWLQERWEQNECVTIANAISRIFTAPTTTNHI
jgi:hypothetical protein